MPKIQSFKALLPNPENVKKVVINLENLSIPAAKQIRAKNPESFVNLLIPKIENHYLRGSRKEIAFKSISENLENFIQKKILIPSQYKAIYVYRQQKNNKTYTGIWTSSSIGDYLNDRIKKHEVTIPERENTLMEYLQQTGIDSNPVLITYPENENLEVLLNKRTQQKAVLEFNLEQTHHQVWEINKSEDLLQICTVFNEMKTVYIADGHHRAAAAAINARESKNNNPNHTGNESYNFFLSVYISEKQLEILPFHRLLKLDREVNIENIINQISKVFKITEIEKQVLIPQQKYQIGMYINGKAFKIDIAQETKDLLNDLDVSILQNHILKPIFNIKDPGNDKRINFVSGDKDLESLLKLIDDKVYDIAFFLNPISVENLMKIADTGQIMPPKSTWFEPKFPAGLITRLI